MNNNSILISIFYFCWFNNWKKVGRHRVLLDQPAWFICHCLFLYSVGIQQRAFQEAPIILSSRGRLEGRGEKSGIPSCFLCAVHTPGWLADPQASLMYSQNKTCCDAFPNGCAPAVWWALFWASRFGKIYLFAFIPPTLEVVTVSCSFLQYFRDIYFSFFVLL